MKILVVCDQGNNRSVTVAHHLKYWGHDVIPIGFSVTSLGTLALLVGWADRIIPVEKSIFNALHAAMGPGDDTSKLQLWDIGPDHFPRPFSPELNAIVKRFTKEHEAEYKPK